MITVEKDEISKFNLLESDVSTMQIKNMVFSLNKTFDFPPKSMGHSGHTVCENPVESFFQEDDIQK